MLERGRSLSGYERNCAFLNTGQTRFADVSAASGLDTLDDGRGVALVDWDFDGKIDMWTSNRTAPWVRLLHNRSETGHHYLALNLRGIGLNRDAIGARVEVRLGGTEPRSLHKAIRAGDGFVAQSSKWLLFGLGTNEVIDSVVVRWPNGDSDAYRGLVADHHYHLTKSDPSPQQWDPPRTPRFHIETPAPAKRGGSSRIFFSSFLPMPRADYLGLDGAPRPLWEDTERPRVINLWASWCAPCMAELRQWSQARDRLLDHVDVVALNVEGIDKTSDVSLEGVRAALSKFDFSLGAGVATPETLEVLEAAVSAQVDKPLPLAIPSSILLDSEGRIAIIYRGPVDVDQFLEELKLIDGTPKELRNRASHFPGRWIEAPPPSDPTILLQSFVMAGRTTAAERYLGDWAEREGSGKSLLDAYYLVADANRMLGKHEQAANLYRKALEFNERQPRVNVDLAICLMRLRRHEEAIEYLEKSLAGDPGNADTRKRLLLALARLQRFAEMEEQAGHLVRMDESDAIARLHLAHALKKQQRHVDALAQYQKCVEQQPNLMVARNDLAWILSTCADDEIRDGEKALELAQGICSDTNFQHPALLDTLAAAQAEVGRFDEAVRTLQSALQLAEKTGDSRLVPILQQHLQLYQQQMPLRED